MWSTVTSKLEAHNNSSAVQSNVQASGVQAQSSGSIKGTLNTCIRTAPINISAGKQHLFKYIYN